MSHYSFDPRSVRVDFWKTNFGGFKWYCTEAVIWTGDYDKGLIHCEFAQSLHDHLLLPEEVILAQARDYRLDDMIATCLEPYHQHIHPIAMHVSQVASFLRDRERYNKVAETP